MWTKCLATIGLCLLLILAGCRHVASAPRLPIPAAPPPGIAALDEADRAFAAKEYDAATHAYEDYFGLSPAQGRQDEALFRLGLIYIFKKAGPDWPRAQTVWKRLIAEYPSSALVPGVELILSLYSEVGQANADMKVRDDRLRQITTELERLKKIDSERRKTP